MNHPIRCKRCGRTYSVRDWLAGKKVRCPACGRVWRIPASNASSSPNPVLQAESEEYHLVERPDPAITHPVAPSHVAGSNDRVATSRRSGPIHWRRFFRASALESSVVEQEIALLIALSAADLLVTYALLRRGPSFYESNPVAQWFFARWNIAGMTGLKFGVVGLVIVIGELVERQRPGWGRTLLAASCLATGAVVWYGLRLLFGYGHDGVPQ